MHDTTCNHTMDSGRPCGSPPLHGKPFCYWHYRLRQDFSVPGTPGYRAPLLESPNSVLVALNHVYVAQARNLIDSRLARNLQSTLRIALQCFRQLDRPEPKELVTNPRDFGANFGPLKEVDVPAGVPSSAVVAEGGVVAPAVCAQVPSPARKQNKSADSTFNPFVIPDRPAKDRYYDPEGCLANFTK